MISSLISGSALSRPVALSRGFSSKISWRCGHSQSEYWQPLSTGDFMKVLSNAVAGGRGNESLFLLRLIDKLGLVQENPLDLTQPNLDPTTTYLDSIQNFLILYDILNKTNVQGASQQVTPTENQEKSVAVTEPEYFELPSDSVVASAAGVWALTWLRFTDCPHYSGRPHFTGLYHHSGATCN